MKPLPLISVNRARKLIAAHCPLVDVEPVPLAQCAGRVLREPVHADRPLPPYNRSAMDGYAVRSADFADGRAELVEVANIPAGTEWSGRLRKGQCASIMTGAPVPAGADAVVKIENTHRDGDKVLLDDPKVGPHFNIHRRGADARRGAALVRPGRALGQSDIGVAASVGATHLAVSRRISVGALSTGREVAPPSATPTPFQIRDANRPALLSILAASPWLRGRGFGIAPDSEKPLARKLARALAACDVVLVSGGVSVGEFDLVPKALDDLGVCKVFHGVAIRPGRPLWFGSTAEGKLVFGLPGNPNSVRIGFREFVIHALRKMAGFAEATPRSLMLPLGAEFHKKHNLTAFYLASLVNTPSGTKVQPVPHEGSGDFVAASQSDGVLVAPAQAKRIPPGELVEFHYWQTD